MRVAPVILAVVLLLSAGPLANADQPDPETEAWRTSPFHGQKDSGTGLPIPCTCRASGRDFRVGERVCMNTPQHGLVLARCDLVNNITSWVPTKSPCTS